MEPTEALFPCERKPPTPVSNAKSAGRKGAQSKLTPNEKTLQKWHLQDRHRTRCMRELLQNALDAVIYASGKSVAEITFRCRLVESSETDFLYHVYLNDGLAVKVGFHVIKLPMEQPYAELTILNYGSFLDIGAFQVSSSTKKDHEDAIGGYGLGLKDVLMVMLDPKQGDFRNTSTTAVKTTNRRTGMIAISHDGRGWYGTDKTKVSRYRRINLEQLSNAVAISDTIQPPSQQVPVLLPSESGVNVFWTCLTFRTAPLEPTIASTLVTRWREAVEAQAMFRTTPVERILYSTTQTFPTFTLFCWPGLWMHAVTVEQPSLVEGVVVPARELAIDHGMTQLTEKQLEVIGQTLVDSNIPDIRRFVRHHQGTTSFWGKTMCHAKKRPREEEPPLSTKRTRTEALFQCSGLLKLMFQDPLLQRYEWVRDVELPPEKHVHAILSEDEETIVGFELSPHATTLLNEKKVSKEMLALLSELVTMVHDLLFTEVVFRQLCNAVMML